VKIAERPAELPRLIEWACQQIEGGSMLLYSTGEPGRIQAVQRYLGHLSAAGLVEHTFGSLAVAPAERGVRTFLVAGGETSAAVLQALRIRMLTFGDELDPGVPWTSSLDPEGFVFALNPATLARETSSSRHWNAHDDGTAGAGGAGRGRALALSARVRLRRVGEPECAPARRRRAS
jgi:hypothetical protein